MVGYKNQIFQLGYRLCSRFFNRKKGYIGTGDVSPLAQDFWEYDQDNNSWTQKSNFGGNGRSVAVGFSIGTKGYIGLGYSTGMFYQDLWEYDPTTDTWTKRLISVDNPGDLLVYLQ
ncbi:MAG: hypothetical protein IPN88_16055 [Bacteroidetes bacterium]|nr:hypothetical protein [Bacteroidota bacterium]